MKIPWGVPSVSSATAIGYTDLEQSVLGLLSQDVSPANFTNFGVAWVKVDSGSNVNIVAGVLTIQGNGSYNANGVYHDAGLLIEKGYYEFEAMFSGSITSALIADLNNTNALRAAITGTNGYLQSALRSRAYQGGTVAGDAAIEYNVWNKYRIYVDALPYGAARSKLRLTIIGGAYATETEIACSALVTAIASPSYLTFQRQANDANTTSVRNVRAYSGYSAASPYIEWIADAGAGKTFDNYDRSSITFPATFPTNNMTFSDSFDDGTADYSVAANLTTWQARGKDTERHRYIRLRAYLVSDGATQIQAPVEGPNSDTATDGAGQFPSTASLMANANVQGVPGDIAVSDVRDTVAGGTLPNAEIAPSAGGKLRVITGISKVRFSVDGGDDFSIYFGYGGASSVTSVKFSGTEMDFEIIDDFQIDCVSPQKGAGTYNLVVDGGGLSGGGLIYAVEYDDKVLSLAEEAVRNNFTGDINDILAPEVLTLANEQVPGAYIPEDPNNIIKSAGGNWNDENLSDSKILLNTIWGLTGLGSLVQKDLTFAEEIARNTDMLAANVRSLLAYVTRGISRIGSFTGSVAVPTKVLNLSAIASGPNSVTLLWQFVAWATSYNIYRDDILIASGVTALSYLDEDCDPNTTYKYKVAGDNTSSGEGPKSDEKEAATPAEALDVFKAQLSTDLDSFFDIDEFAENITLLPASGSAGYVVRAIFDNAFESVNPNTEMDILSTSPVLHIRERDLTAVLQPQDRFRIRGILFSVVTNEPDGVGIIKLSLHRV